MHRTLTCACIWAPIDAFCLYLQCIQSVYILQSSLLVCICMQAMQHMYGSLQLTQNSAHSNKVSCVKAAAAYRSTYLSQLMREIRLLQVLSLARVHATSRHTMTACPLISKNPVDTLHTLVHGKNPSSNHSTWAETLSTTQSMAPHQVRLHG